MLEFCHQQTSPGTPSVAYDAQHYAQMPSHNLLSQSMLLHDCSMMLHRCPVTICRVEACCSIDGQSLMPELPLSP